MSEPHSWIQHDGSGISRTCDPCKLGVVRLDEGPGYSLQWSYSDGRRGQAATDAELPECTGYPAPSGEVPNIPTTAVIIKGHPTQGVQH